MKSTPIKTLRAAINQAYLADEQEAIKDRLKILQDYDPSTCKQSAQSLITAVRKNKGKQSLVEAFLHEYQLNSEEGIVLMSIAEALLRIPDTQTQDLFLQEKLSDANWHDHLQHSDSLLVNLSTGALLLTGKIEAKFLHSEQHKKQVFEKLLSRLGLPLIRSALKQAMQQLAYQFVIAETIEQALHQSDYHPMYRYSFDMLGEAALTANDVERYYHAYLDAIKKLAIHSTSENLLENPSISIKLSALCPRFEPLQHHRATKELTTKLLFLAKQARMAGISVTIDAEETERLEITLEIFAKVFTNPVLQDWPGLGIAVQAYQKRAIHVIHWLAALSESRQQKIPLRLVKGAYWDTEIKRAQENGLSNYPVFTSKSATDVSFLACAKLILNYSKDFFPQFATHNAHTVAAIFELGKHHPGFEFQRLHGMGERLYAEILEHQNWPIPCRVYAPVGRYQDLLPYLVRRLLENGANTSFINQIENPELSIDQLINDPVDTLQQQTTKPKQPRIVLPSELFGTQRENSKGLNLADPDVLAQLQHDLDNIDDRQYQAAPLVDGLAGSGKAYPIINPFNRHLTVGRVVYSGQANIEQALYSSHQAFTDWRLTPVKLRADYLLKTANLLQNHSLELVSLCIREGGRTIRDSLAEIREAVDFCRYYAASATTLFDRPLNMPGPTGEENRLFHYGRGVFVCISPWNFPVAIFIGQVTAALAAGNTVIAKPAQQTPLTAMRCIQLLHQAGIPENVLHYLPGDGASIGRHLLADSRIAGVAFTGSTTTAQLINRQLAQHSSIVPFIAETGGQNVMIADSSAHAEQLVQDVLQSAFNSAGQRCSALRVLFLQHEIADQIIDRLNGAMQQLTVGNPGCYSIDIGPVIHPDAVKQLSNHVQKMKQQALVVNQMRLPKNLQFGSFFPPSLIELTRLSELEQEVFGPVLHIIRYRSSELKAVIEAINNTGYGLTLGIHSRINANIRTIQQGVRVGNIYVNRNMIGAVVGVQPFGGMGFSGTGPKAGGPDYLRRFSIEQTLTINTAAIGGNTSLMSQDLS